MLRQIVEPMGVLFDKFLVVQSFLEDDVDDPEGQGLGRTGTQLEPEVGLLGQLGPAGIDDDQLGAVLQLIDHLAGDLPLFVGGGEVAGPEEHQFRGMVEIGNRIEAAGVDARDLPAGVADILGGDDIGRAEDVGQADQDEMLQPLGHADAEPHGPRAVLFLDAFRDFPPSRPSACSQEMRCHFPSPRSPARFRGCLRRSGWVRRSADTLPLKQV